MVVELVVPAPLKIQSEIYCFIPSTEIILYGVTCLLNHIAFSTFCQNVLLLLNLLVCL